MKLIRKLAEFVDLRDIFALSGLIVFLYGVAEIYPPAAWIIGGMLLMAFALIGMRK